ncbi:hypothetical protein BH24DEI1_BH24DEI1_20450 [soil metagenome]|jgi:hypothetical protein|nr:hypothetical protein [Deinococcota bacterium]
MEKLSTSQQEITELEHQAMDIRTRLVREWDVDTHIELTTRLFALESRVASAIIQTNPLRA